MKKRILLSLLIAFAALVPAHAAFQFDMGLTFPFLHFAVGSEGAEFMPPDRSGLQYLIMYDDVTIHYYFQAGPLKVGPGIRTIGFALLNYIYPVLSAEWDIGAWRLRVMIGGGAILQVGYLSYGAYFGPIIIPELSLARELSDWMSLGLAVTWPFWKDDTNYDGWSPMDYIDFQSAMDGIDLYEQDSVLFVSFFIRFTFPVVDGS